MTDENVLMKALNKYSLVPEKIHYPSKPFHLEYTAADKPEEKKSIYEKIFFDNVSNKVESEKLNPPIKLYREATKNPNA